MSNHGLRKDKTCLNCFHVVDQRFCPNCGQENTETRKSFSHLIAHFAEDFTHYDNAFWTTIKYLLFRPALLTKEYLSGKRQRFVPPVKLYIFISFVTFFLLSVIPDANETEAKATPEAQKKGLSVGTPKQNRDIVNYNNTTAADSIALDSIVKKGVKKGNSKFVDFESLEKYDSVQKTIPISQRDGKILSWLKHKTIEVMEKATKEENYKEKFKETLFHNIPKALFLYLPFFAFGLWIFHDKKRWYYFDHGIFTLHYFSFLLFTFSIATIIAGVTDHFDNPVINTIDGFIRFGLMCWWFFYFFRSHRRFYEESRMVSRTKSFLLFIINMFFIFVFMMLLMAISALAVH